MEHHQLIFAGGGTGGHIFPALAIAEHAREIDPSVGVHVLCSTRAVDTNILNKESVGYTPIPARPPITRPMAALRFAMSWFPALGASKRAIHARQELGPVTLIAMGGFVCAPAVAAARALGVPVVLVNLDAVPGKANRHVATRAARVFTACKVEADGGGPAWDDVGAIVRPAFSKAGENTDPSRVVSARGAFGLEGHTKTMLVTGGSQGATSINELFKAMLAEDAGAFEGWQVIHQVGEHHEPAELRACYEQAGVRAWVERFISENPADMPAAWLASDLSIGRCGAGTVAEAWATRTPAVFFPYPYHTDGHQKANAQALVKAGAAIVLDDRVDPDKNMGEHGSVLFGLLTDPARLDALREPAQRLRPVDGARRVAQALLDQ